MWAGIRKLNDEATINILSAKILQLEMENKQLKDICAEYACRLAIKQEEK